MFSGDECGWNYVISLKLYKNMKMKSLIFFDVQFVECVCENEVCVKSVLEKWRFNTTLCVCVSGQNMEHCFLAHPALMSL